LALKIEKWRFRAPFLFCNPAFHGQDRAPDPKTTAWPSALRQSGRPAAFARQRQGFTGLNARLAGVNCFFGMAWHSFQGLEGQRAGAKIPSSRVTKFAARRLTRRTLLADDGATPLHWLQPA